MKKLLKISLLIALLASCSYNDLLEEPLNSNNSDTIYVNLNIIDTVETPFIHY